MGWDGKDRRKKNDLCESEIQLLREDFREFKSDIKYMIDKIGEHNSTLYGNGSPGLKSRVERHSVIINIVIAVGSLLGTSLVTAMLAAFYKIINLS